MPEENADLTPPGKFSADAYGLNQNFVRSSFFGTCIFVGLEINFLTQNYDFY